MARQLASLSERDKRVKHGWNCYRKLLEEKQHFILFEKICNTVITQIQELLKERDKDKVKQEIGPIKEKLAKIYEAAENYHRNKKYSHGDQMKLWIDKIKVSALQSFFSGRKPLKFFSTLEGVKRTPLES